MTQLNYASIGNKNISPHMLNKKCGHFPDNITYKHRLLALHNIPPLALITKILIIISKATGKEE
jgi:hypothetical protein